MTKKKGSKRRKRVAAHIRENQGKRAAAAASGEGEVGADKRAPLLAPPLGVGKSKRPREPDAVATGVAARDNPARKEKERTDATNYLAAWLSLRKAKEAAEEAGVPPPASNGVWKFNKNTQAWLLRNVFSDDPIGEKSFGTLCLYLEGLKGAGRQRVLAAAQEIIDKHGPDEGNEQTAAAREAARDAAVLEAAAADAADAAEEAAAAVAPSGYNSDSADDGGEGESDSGGKAVAAAGGQGGGGVVMPQPVAAGVIDGGGGGGGEFSFSFFDGKAPKTTGVGAPAKKQQPDSDSGSTSSSDDSEDGSDDDNDDEGQNGAGGADGAAEASPPAAKKQRKARSALTGESKAAAKAKAAAVAYERALQVAEVLA